MTRPMRGLLAYSYVHGLPVILVSCTSQGLFYNLVALCNLSLRDSTPSCIAWCGFFSHLPPWELAHWAATAMCCGCPPFPAMCWLSAFPHLCLDSGRRSWEGHGTRIECNFFSQSLRAPPGYPGEIPGYAATKIWFPWISKDIPNFLAPTPSRGRPPPHPRNPEQKVWVWVLGGRFSPEKKYLATPPPKNSPVRSRHPPGPSAPPPPGNSPLLLFSIKNRPLPRLELPPPLPRADKKKNPKGPPRFFPLIKTPLRIGVENRKIPKSG